MVEQGLIEAEDEPTAEELRRFDKGRKNKRVSNDEWVSESDADSRIAKMKDGRTHLAYKAEHVIDLDTELVLAAEIYPANHADTDTLVDSVLDAQENFDAAGLEVEIEEAVADKGYHAAPTLELADGLNLRTYIPEPKYAYKRTWTDKPAEYQRVVYNNRRRTQTAKSKRMQRQRSEKVERSFAHICETGGARRTWLCGFDKVRKRYLMSAVARNLGLIMRVLFGLGTARSLQTQGGSSTLRYRAWIAMLLAPSRTLARWFQLERRPARNPSFARLLAHAA